MVRVSGERYEGYFVNNKFEGNGHMVYSEDPAQKKRDYKGTWKNGMREGYGKMTWKSGARYDGYWFMDMRQGQGKYFWSDGSWYLGEFKINHRHGIGN